MKFRGLLFFALTLAVGFLAGAWFAPVALRQSGAGERGLASGETATPSDAAGPSKSAATSHSKPASASEEVPDLATLIKETDMQFAGSEGSGSSFRMTRQIVAYVNSLAPEDFPRVIHQLEPKMDRLDSGLVTALMSRWAEVDPQAALAYSQKEGGEPLIIREAFHALADQNLSGAVVQARQLPPGTNRDAALWTIAQKMVATDPMQALALAKTVANGDILASQVMALWAVTDPDAATQQLMQVHYEQDRTNIAVNMAEKLAADDPQKAADWLKQLPPGMVHDEAMKRVESVLAQTDPTGALSLADEMPDSPVKSEIVFSVVAVWATSDPRAAEAYVDGLPDGRVKNNLVASFITPLAQKDIHAAVDFLNQLDPATAAKYKQVISASWALDDPQGALDYGKSLPTGPERNHFLQSVVSELFIHDPASGAQWLKQLPADAQNDALFDSSFAGAWIRQDPASAASYVLAMPPGDGQNKLLGDVAGAMADEDPIKAIDWVNRLPDNSVGKSMAMTDVATEWAKKDPARAMDYFQTMQDGPAKQSAIAYVTESWALNAPASAAQWVTTLPEGPQRNDAIVRIAEHWENQDQAQTATWLTQLPQGPSRDLAVKAYSDYVSNRNPAEAEKWAESIGDPAARQDTVYAVLQKWMSLDYDTDTVTTAVQNSDLPDNLKKQILQQTPAGGNVDRN